ncbi:GNAT family N-acetyltransferase [Streptomyces sp. NBC_00273]|uniref:GNAT family N-acetyltransferase n=1 Tax=Streptomyces sp. NBC_00273 TaxID=2903644 RepID=UPI002E29B02F|nr:GNAT family N-acetyltransferase [Streptomyces sp. NBC_00273]
MALRALTLDDAPALTRIYSGASVRYTTGRALSLDQAPEKIRSALVRAAATPRAQWSWGILAADEMIGLIALRRRSPVMGTISYILREDTWGNGYATDAAQQVVAFAFTTAGLERVEAMHHPANPASGRCPGQGRLLPQRYHRPACRRWGRRAIRDVRNPKQGALRRRRGAPRGACPCPGLAALSGRLAPARAGQRRPTVPRTRA